MAADSSAANAPIKFQSNVMIQTANLTASRLHDLTIRRLIGYRNRAQGDNMACYKDEQSNIKVPDPLQPLYSTCYKY